MNFAEYLDSVENTEQEQQMIQKAGEFKNAIIGNNPAGLEKLKKVPIFGKVFLSLFFLADCNNFDEFRQSEYFDNIKNWDIKVSDLENGNISILPGAKHKKFMLKISIFVCVALFVVCMCRKYRNIDCD